MRHPKEQPGVFLTSLVSTDQNSSLLYIFGRFLSFQICSGHVECLVKLYSLLIPRYVYISSLSENWGNDFFLKGTRSNLLRSAGIRHWTRCGTSVHNAITPTTTLPILLQLCREMLLKVQVLFTLSKFEAVWKSNLNDHKKYNFSINKSESSFQSPAYPMITHICTTFYN